MILLNKIDMATQEVLDAKLAEWKEKLPNAEIIPISALKKFNLEKLDCPVFEHLPYPQIYCGLSQHKDNNFCPLKKAKAYSNWYNETIQ